MEIESEKYDVVVIGAGITGLTTAYYLAKEGFSVAVVEKEGRVGGQIASFDESGFVFESGPNTGVLSNVEAVELFEDLQGECTLDIARREAKKRLIFKSGKLHALPSGLFSAVATPLFSFSDKLRVLGEPFRSRGVNPDESVADLTVRRLGRSFLNYAIDPFISGIYAGDPHKLVTRFALPKLYSLEQEHGSFIKGAVAKGRTKKNAAEKKVTKEVFSAEAGLGSLPDALCRVLQSDTWNGRVRIFLNAGGATAEPGTSGWKISFAGSSEIMASGLITTTGGYELPALLPFVGAREMQPLSALKYAGIVQVAVGIKDAKKYEYEAFGALIPTAEKRQVLGILFPSACFGRRAPRNGMLCSVFIGGVRHPEYLRYTDEQIKTLVRDEMQTVLGIPRDTRYDLFRIFRHEKAIPQYEADSLQRYESIRRLQTEYKNMIVAGNVRDGIGMSDRIRQGKTVALEMAALLKRQE